MTLEARPAASAWEQLWTLYHDAFAPLQELALLNHLYPRDDFEALLADERVIKLIAWSSGEPVGLAMLTNELDLVPQISPPFLHARYPDQAGRNAVFFGIMVFVNDEFRRTSTFARLVAGMGEITAEAAGVVVFDICRHNLAELELDRQMTAIARWFPGSTFDRVDEQTYFAACLPKRPERRLPFTALPTDETSAPSRWLRSVGGIAAG